jgi:hypothetical protein
MMKLAQIFNGKGPLYVSLFAEFQTYAPGALLRQSPLYS